MEQLFLAIILLVVFLSPLSSKTVEKNLELFLFLTGLITVLVMGRLDKTLVITSMKEPLLLVCGVLIFGLLFKIFNNEIREFVFYSLEYIPLKVFLFFMVLFLGLIASITSAIIASLLLVEILDSVNIKRNIKIRLVVITCFAIGMGAALTPLGEPLSAIATGKLDEDFWYLLQLLGYYIVPCIIFLGALASMIAGNSQFKPYYSCSSGYTETFMSILARSFRIYIFVIALFFLGEGFKPLMDRFISIAETSHLYWINMMSAVLDNATLAAAQLNPQMPDHQVRAVLISLVISGGMLIPGNIPNIISAGKMGISSREWAFIGLPIGVFLMGVYYLLLFF